MKIRQCLSERCRNVTVERVPQWVRTPAFVAEMVRRATGRRDRTGEGDQRVERRLSRSRRYFCLPHIVRCMPPETWKSAFVEMLVELRPFGATVAVSQCF